VAGGTGGIAQLPPCSRPDAQGSQHGQRIGLAPAGVDPPHAEWHALVRGYDRVRPLSPAERRVIPALAAVRAVWVMALPAAPGATWGQDWLLDPEYLGAHLGMIERLATAARAASPAAITQP